jgi:hypothetical protein
MALPFEGCAPLHPFTPFYTPLHPFTPLYTPPPSPCLAGVHVAYDFCVYLCPFSCLEGFGCHRMRRWPSHSKGARLYTPLHPGESRLLPWTGDALQTAIIFLVASGPAMLDGMLLRPPGPRLQAAAGARDGGGRQGVQGGPAVQCCRLHALVHAVLGLAAGTPLTGAPASLLEGAACYPGERAPGTGRAPPWPRLSRHHARRSPAQHSPCHLPRRCRAVRTRPLPARFRCGRPRAVRPAAPQDPCPPPRTACCPALLIRLPGGAPPQPGQCREGSPHVNKQGSRSGARIRWFERLISKRTCRSTG